MKHWCHCFSSVSIFSVLCNLSRMLFPQLHDGKLFRSVSLRQVFTNVGNSFAQGSELRDGLYGNIPALMETDVSRKQQESGEFSFKALQMRLLR